MTSTIPRKITDDLWIFSRPFKRFGILPLGGRSVAIKLSDGTVWVLASTPPDDQTRKEIDSLGTVTYIVSPNTDHHFFLAAFKEVYPNAKLVGPAALAEKRKDLKFDALIGEDASGSLGYEEDIQTIHFSGTALSDTAFYHAKSKTLVVGDLIYNLPNTESMPEYRASLWKSLSPGGLAHTKLISGAAKDRTSVQTDVKTVAALDFDRIIPLHGDIIETGGLEKWRIAYAAAKLF